LLQQLDTNTGYNYTLFKLVENVVIG
jgi:hypothetical protein